jgi:hypothetical protein
MGLGVQVRAQRGRFYLERPLDEGDDEGDAGIDDEGDAGIGDWGRITPLADSADLLLEQQRRKNTWTEIARGSAKKLLGTVASDTKGTFHGLGALDKALRKAGKGLERLPVLKQGKTKFVYAQTGEVCSAQEAMFHYFGVPLHVLVEPYEWYSRHRTPTIVDCDRDRTRVLVRFGAMSWSGEDFGGTCLYACQDGDWDAYRIKPSESKDIASAESWLVKRKWREWG